MNESFFYRNILKNMTKLKELEYKHFVTPDELMDPGKGHQWPIQQSDIQAYTS